MHDLSNDGSSFFVFEERVLDFDSVLKIRLFCWCVCVFGLTQKIPNLFNFMFLVSSLRNGV
jgi:hypothetical protein